MSLKTLFSDNTNLYRPIASTDWNNIDRTAVYAINTRQGDFNIEVDNADPHEPIISLNQNLDVQNLTALNTIGTSDFNATTAGIATLNVGSVANTPQLNANNILNGTLTLPNSIGATGTFLASDGSTGTIWVAQTTGGNISNTDGNLTISSGSTGSFNINLSTTITTDSIINGTLTLPNVGGNAGDILCSDGSTGTTWIPLTNTDDSLGISVIDNEYVINLSNTIYPLNVNTNQIQITDLYGSTGSYYLTDNSNQLSGQVLTDSGDNTPLTFKYPLSLSGNNLTLTSGTGGYINNLELNADLLVDNITNGSLVLPNIGGNAGDVLSSDGSTGTSWIPQSGLTSNTLYVNDNVSDLQPAINTAGNGYTIFMSSGSYGGSVVGMTGKTNLAIVCPFGVGTITELANRGINIDNTNTGISISNLQLGASSNLSANSGKYERLNFTGFGAIYTFGTNTTGYIICQNCDFSGTTGVIVDATFGNVIYFINCNFGNCALSFLQSSSSQVVLENCVGLTTFSPSNCSVLAINALTSGATQINTNALQINSVSGATGNYFLPSGNNGMTGSCLVYNGDGTSSFSNNIVVDTLTIQGAGAGMTGYQMPNNVGGVPLGSILTYTGINPMTNLGFLNFIPPSPTPTSFIYSSFGSLGALTFNNGIDNYVIPTIKFYKDNSLVNVVFDFTLGNLYIVSSPTDNPAVFKTTTPVDVSLRPQTYLNLSINNGGILSNAPPYTMLHTQTTYFSIDSSGYLYISLPFSDSWQKNMAYAMSSVSPIDMTAGIGWTLSNVSCSYLL